MKLTYYLITQLGRGIHMRISDNAHTMGNLGAQTTTEAVVVVAAATAHIDITTGEQSDPLETTTITMSECVICSCPCTICVCPYALTSVFSPYYLFVIQNPGSLPSYVSSQSRPILTLNLQSAQTPLNLVLFIYHGGCQHEDLFFFFICVAKLLPMSAGQSD